MKNNTLTLAGKYRPQCFEDIVEQDSIKAILENQIKTNNLKHAYLFCGSAGCGKTTSARIIANHMNEGKAPPIELDCASHNSVDDVRVIINECKSKPMVGKYKIFLLDECFEGNSKVQTSNGEVAIKDINIGDYVYTSSGLNKVVNKHITKVSDDRLCKVRLDNGNAIVVTKNHLFMTTNGWVEAYKLKEGDELIVYSELSKLWEVDNYSKKREEVLQQRLLPEMVKDKTQESINIVKEMCNLWKSVFGDSCPESYENVFSSMQKQINIAVREDYNEFRIWDGTKETILTKNVKMQSNGTQAEHRQDDEDERIEWNSKFTNQEQRGQWTLYRTSIEIIQQFERFLGIGVSNTYTNKKEQQSDEISYSVQSRPWLFRAESSNRSGWEVPQYENWYTARYEKADKTRGIRVESVTLQEPTDNGQYRECTRGYTEVYDLEIENDHSYFVENVLVHNCHMLTVQGWNAMLKILEEPPEYVIFLFCTTDPQKIIGTVLSRVQRFNFSRISIEGITNRLVYIINSENKERLQANELQITYEDNAINYIARLAKGGMRDAITTLEKCLDYSNELTLDNVLTVTSGSVTEPMLLELLADILNGHCDKALLLFERIYMSGVDVSLFLKLWVEYLQNCTKYMITQTQEITTLSDISVNRLNKALQLTPKVRNLLEEALQIKNVYSTDDLKILIESWLIQVCSL